MWVGVVMLSLLAGEAGVELMVWSALLFISVIVVHDVKCEVVVVVVVVCC
jgi:hypothetical protein